MYITRYLKYIVSDTESTHRVYVHRNLWAKSCKALDDVIGLYEMM